ncbi:hypothetical protein [Burkholderia ambifaria]|uniref:hypothetical protein n=1 Tax=Burkholderia ambifaria TaxID=152480 RepID=UPI0033965BB8
MVATPMLEQRETMVALGWTVVSDYGYSHRSGWTIGVCRVRDRWGRRVVGRHVAPCQCRLTAGGRAASSESDRGAGLARFGRARRVARRVELIGRCAQRRELAVDDVDGFRHHDQQKLREKD